ncbi:hypothetical protein CYLTODRAFT_453048 [Cylindrobasidium torrendii FP15055 ss-10]|uniref:Hyaluronan/mRNA-binding protein domain-containing protein n=1 Tax=Cylindrobasidium torrendii FP15055 ss-10 TaxID=1314674 RepID=A0A0D7BFM3_9AGAR|nr:hypothetical protein CYLTODRAFT_453048 [Cylindrobasidium torrendii FP15055 ss-10]
MTRTARSGFPRAMMHDRSESRSGLDKSMRKGGAGGHNWGSLADERDVEAAALDDEGIDMLLEEGDDSTDTASLSSDNVTESSKSTDDLKNVEAAPEADLAAAKKFRKHAFKGNVDLASIARTSAAVSTSPPTH